MTFKGLQEKYNFPDFIKVEVRKTNSGFSAYLIDYPGCMTLAGSIPELIENVNDAVLTYFEVPRGEAKKIKWVYYPDFLKVKSATRIYPLNFRPLPPQFYA